MQWVLHDINSMAYFGLASFEKRVELWMLKFLAWKNNQWSLGLCQVWFVVDLSFGMFNCCLQKGAYQFPIWLMLQKCHQLISFPFMMLGSDGRQGCEEFSKVSNTKIICMNSLLFVENFEVVFNELRIWIYNERDHLYLFCY